MQIKKVDWIGKPGSVRVNAHSLRFIDEKTSYALYTIGECDSLRLERCGTGVSFALLHTDKDYILISKEDATISFAGSMTKVELKCPDVVIVKKEDGKVTFSTEEGKELVSFSYHALFKSTSIGFKTSASGFETTLSFFQES